MKRWHSKCMKEHNWAHYSAFFFLNEQTEWFGSKCVLSQWRSTTSPSILRLQVSSVQDAQEQMPNMAAARKYFCCFIREKLGNMQFKKKNKEPALCCFLKWASFILVYLTFCSVLLWVDLQSAFSPTFPNCPPWSPGATELSYYNGDEWEASGEKRQEGEQLSWQPKHQLSSTPSCSLIPQLHTSRLFLN